ncbi:hypothetical protein M011DRAFT_127545 [Sporormia fimetaria CBS 119925]|uniref:Uncharacterized protein n=1 Tax=Sporormia fimetaria CBS 119925 TaxID=1340428 RepID=A0A6A6V882_9PLEO|nr:hypothetical protein M011DRAFT_127545 [Sporormia fimetaria CBS 119925]
MMAHHHDGTLLHAIYIDLTTSSYRSLCSTFNQYFLSTLGFQSTISFSESLLFTVLISPPVQRTLTLIPENQPRSINGTSIPAGPSQ